MRRHSPVMMVALALVLASCGGGSNTTTTSVVAHFTADAPNPGPKTIAIQQDSTNGASVVLRVTVTDVQSFFGAAFRITYDPNALLFGGWDTSSSLLLENGVPAANVLFSEDHTSLGGTLVVVATRVDPTVAPPIDVGTTSTLVKINFIARKPIAAGAVEGRLDFGDPRQVCDGSVNPTGCNEIAGITWSGGGLSAR